MSKKSVLLTGAPGTAAYTAAKAGLSGICKTISKELFRNWITVNHFFFGYFEAALLFQIPQDIQNQIKKSNLKREFGSLADVIESILYLRGENSPYLTCKSIDLNGGLF